MIVRLLMLPAALLAGWSGTAVSATLPAAVEPPPVSMDGRFSGFDAIAYIREQHPALAAQAEIVSHWAGYYSVNPILLARATRLLSAQTPQTHVTAAGIRSLARSLAPLEASERAPGRDGFAAQEQLVQALATALALPADAADRLLRDTRMDMEAAGLSQPLATSSALPPALDLPFARPQAWKFNGVHTWTGDNDGSPKSSLDFTSSWSQDWGDDTSATRVVAAHDGEVTVYSTCFVQVQHAGGWATRYYHLDNLKVSNGQQVRAGDDLGNYANNRAQALCSGGSSSGPHLHFALLRDAQYASLADVALSGYLIHPGTASYDSHPDRMWLEKRAERYYAYNHAVFGEEGDNIIDYRYNGMWYSPGHDGHGMNVEITEMPQGGGSRKTAFVVIYTYDDAGQANFYVGNRDFERWRSDETMVIELLQTAGGDFANLLPIDFDDPDQVMPAGDIELRFYDCGTAQAELMLDERSSSQPAGHSLALVKLIGVPGHVCAAASLPLP
jgi:LasA protease